MKNLINNIDELNFHMGFFLTEHNKGAELLSSAASENHRATIYTTQAESPTGPMYTALTLKPFGQSYNRTKVLIYVDDNDATLKISFRDFAGEEQTHILSAFSIMEDVANPPPTHSRPIG